MLRFILFLDFLVVILLIHDAAADDDGDHKDVDVYFWFMMR